MKDEDRKFLHDHFQTSVEKVIGGKPKLAVLVDTEGALVEAVSSIESSNADAVATSMKKAILLAQRALCSGKEIYLENDLNKRHACSQGRLIKLGEEVVGAWAFLVYEEPCEEIIFQTKCRVASEKGLWAYPLAAIWSIAQEFGGLHDIFIRRLKDNSINSLGSIVRLISKKIGHEEELIVFTHSYSLQSAVSKIADLIEDLIEDQEFGDIKMI